MACRLAYSAQFRVTEHLEDDAEFAACVIVEGRRLVLASQLRDEQFHHEAGRSTTLASSPFTCFQ